MKEVTYLKQRISVILALCLCVSSPSATYAYQEISLPEEDVLPKESATTSNANKDTVTDSTEDLFPEGDTLVKEPATTSDADKDMVTDSTENLLPEEELLMEEPLAQLAARDGAIPSPSQVYDAMIALKDQDGFREGTTWTNFEPYGSKGNLGSAYKWNGGAIYGANSGVGCMAFAFILSDEAFGNLPARPIKKGSFSFEDVK